jgi:lipopolysaccharide export system protein LptA
MMRYLLGAIVLAGMASSAWPVQNTDGASRAAAHSSAFGNNSNAPINVSSDNFVGNFQTKVGTYNGNVIVTQADDKLHADTVKVDVVAGKPSRLEASGHVVFVSSSGTATGDNGIYDLGPRTITLTGHVVLTKDKDVMRGTSLVVNMNTGESHLTAHGAQGNRVQGLFVQQPQSSAAGGKPGGRIKQ